MKKTLQEWLDATKAYIEESEHELGEELKAPLTATEFVTDLVMWFDNGGGQ